MAELTPEQEQRALEMASQGRRPADVIATLRMSRWAFATYRRNHPEFAQRWAEACREGVHAMVDDLREIHEQWQDAPAVATVASHNIRWIAARQLPEVYGDNMRIDHNVTIDLAGPLERARERAKRIEAARVATQVLPDAVDAIEIPHVKRIAAVGAPDTESDDEDADALYR